ncbi:hypothetical protein C8F01DRAFT_1295169 [Mycena amicta]|nr:hypothetical protein C8F01DRAFT_1295169 [Mycena amicta]
MLVPSTMSAPVDKSSCSGLWIHRLPSGIAEADFKAIVDATAQQLLALPVCQKNFIRFDAIYSNDAIEKPMAGIGLGSTMKSVWWRFECESEDNFVQILRDPGVATVTAQAMAQGLQLSETSCCFMADKVTRIDRRKESDVLYLFGVRAPVGLSLKEFHANMGILFDSFVALPIAQKRVNGHTAWYPKKMAEANAFSYSYGLGNMDDCVLLFAEFGSLALIFEMFRDSAFVELVETVLTKPMPTAEVWTFTAEAVNMI